MTRIRLGIITDYPDGTLRQARGGIEWKPSRRRDVGDDVVIPRPFEIPVSPDLPAPIIDVSPTTSDWAWVVSERTIGGIQRYVQVPSSSAIIDYQDLVDVDPATLEVSAQPEAAWWLALENFTPPDAADPAVIAQAIQDYMQTNGDELLTTHINDPEPHPVYDDMASLRLIYENGLI